MEQLLWMFSFIPAWVYHLLLICAIIGLAGASFLGRLPFFNQYKLPFQVLMGMILIFSIWMHGVIANESKWQAKIKEMEEKVAVAETSAKEKTTEIQEKIVEKIKEIRVKGPEIIKTVTVPGPERIKEVTKDMSNEQKATYDKKIKELEESVKNCPIPQLAIEAHNEAANAGKGEKK